MTMFFIGVYVGITTAAIVALVAIIDIIKNQK